MSHHVRCLLNLNPRSFSPSTLPPGSAPSDSATVWDPSSTEDWSQGASDFAATWQTTNTPDSLILACNPHNQPGDIGWKPFCQVPCVQYGVFDEPYWWDTSRSGLDSYSGGGGIPHPFCPCGVTPPVQRP
ncbi:MAG: hypothetical protein WDW36_005110 [Sanguina aurantia]